MTNEEMKSEVFRELARIRLKKLGPEGIRRIASLGGKAAAAKLTKEQLSARARKGLEARLRTLAARKAKGAGA